MHWVRWDRVLAAKDEGCLGVGSLYSFNRAMMLRWWWRFYHGPNLLWIRVIKSFYGPDGGCSSLATRRGGTCPWNGVICMFVQLRGRGIDYQSLCPIRIGDGRYTSL